MPGVLLLHNGQTIEGRIERTGDRFRVFLPDGELRLRVTEVEYVCRNLEEGYQRKRATIQPGNIHDHFQLAQWCQRQGLFGCAANELSAAMDIDPNHPMIELLQRRLKMALEKPEPPRPAAEPDRKMPSAEELDRLVRGMPAGTVETFAQVIQPILVNHCMSGGCHGSQSETHLQLLRVTAGQPASRRVTQRNLHAVMQWIDREHPAASRLLTTTSGLHGTSRTPIFTNHQTVQYRRLLEWVYQVAQQLPPSETGELFATQGNTGAEIFEAPGTPAALPAKTPRLQPLPRPSRTTRAHALRTVAGEEALSEAGGDALPSSSGKPAQKARVSGAASAAGLGEVPAQGDPFDPDAFNRQLSPSGDSPDAPAPMPTPAARALHGPS